MPWVSTADELAERERHAGELVGRRIARVRYFGIESSEPSWRFAGFDAVDYGLELDTSDGTTFGAAWAMAGPNWGLSFRQELLQQTRLEPDGAFAIWDVTSRSLWAPFVGMEVTGVTLFWWRPERDSDLCCGDVWLEFGEHGLLITLGDADGGRYVGSADNVAVVDDASARRHGLGPYGSPSEPL